MNAETYESLKLKYVGYWQIGDEWWIKLYQCTRPSLVRRFFNRALLGITWTDSAESPAYQQQLDRQLAANGGTR